MAPSLDAFFETMGRHNPFEANRVTPASGHWADAAGIFAEPFRRLQHWTTLAQRERLALGVLLSGEPGIGKSHLLGRLARWGNSEPIPALVVTLPNLQAEPQRLPRAILRAVVNQLTAGRTGQFRNTFLFRIANGTIRHAVKDFPLDWKTRDLKVYLHRSLDALSKESPGRAALLDRTFFDVLLQFLRACANNNQAQLASHAVDWLRGDRIDPEAARRLGIPGGTAAEEGVGLADDEQVKGALVALAQAAWFWGRPLVLALDQVDNLEPAQFRALARFLHALLDASTNLVVITAGVRETLLRWSDEKVIQTSSWDRLAQYPLELQRLSPAQSLPLLTVRLQPFLGPFAQVEEVRQRAQQDPYFPLGQAWVQDQLDSRIDFRPRDVLNGARLGWEQQQQLLAEKGGAAWLAGWVAAPLPPEVGRPLTPEQLRQRIDQAIVRQLEEEEAACRQRLENYGWDPEGLADLLHELLKNWVRREHWPFLQNVERITVRGQQRPTFHLLLHQRLSPTGPDLKRAVACLLATDGNVLTNQLRRLHEGGGFNQLLLLYEQRSVLNPGRHGREWLEELTRSLGGHFSQVPISLEENVHLGALQAVLGKAKSGELEVPLSEGGFHRVERNEALESLVRQGLFPGSPLLRFLLNREKTAENQEREVLLGNGSLSAAPQS